MPHVGWPVALVVAETPSRPGRPPRRSSSRYDEEPHDVVFSAGPPRYVHAAGNPAARAETEKGDVEAELAASAVVVDEEYTTPEEHHTAMEPHAAMARWDGGRLEVVDSNQGTHVVAQDLAQAVLPRRGLGTGAVGARRRRLRVQGLIRPHLVARRDGRHRARPPGPGRPDPPSDVLARRLPQPHGAADPARRRRATGGCARSTTDAESLTSTMHEFVEQSAQPSRVMYARRRAPHQHRVVRLDVPTPTFMRAPGEAPGLVRPGVGDGRTRREAAAWTRSRCASATNPRPGPPPACRSAAAICIACFEEGAAPVRLGGPGSASRDAPRRALAARNRHGRGHLPRRGRARPRRPSPPRRTAPSPYGSTRPTSGPARVPRSP